jgi:hypothetical protein
MSQKHKAHLANAAYRKAKTYELNYGCCPQCVLSSVQQTVGLIGDDVIKASHGLSGGGGLLGLGTCGALSGGLLALSCKRGRAHDKLDKGRFISNFRAGEELVNRFQQEFGGVTCAQLQKLFTGQTYDMWDPEQYAEFDQQRGDRGAHASGMVSKWVVEML